MTKFLQNDHLEKSSWGTGPGTEGLQGQGLGSWMRGCRRGCRRLQERLQEGQEEEHRKKSHLDDDKELGGQGLQAVQNL